MVSEWEADYQLHTTEVLTTKMSLLEKRNVIG